MIIEPSSNQEQIKKENIKIPFEYITFSDFVALVGRLFYDDACIILLDFLAKEKKSFLESDLREKLGWRESLVQQKLYLLEKHMLVVSDAFHTKGSRSSAYWRIHHRIDLAVQYRYEVVIQYLARLVDCANKQHEFECSSTDCDRKFTALEAASCYRRLEDNIPLCSFCKSTLKLSALEEILTQAKQKRMKYLHQLEPLRQSLLSINNMDIPIFPVYSKKKTSNEIQDSTEAKSSVEDFSKTTVDTSFVSESDKKPSYDSIDLNPSLIPWFQPFELNEYSKEDKNDYNKKSSTLMSNLPDSASYSYNLEYTDFLSKSNEIDLDFESSWNKKSSRQLFSTEFDASIPDKKPKI